MGTWFSVVTMTVGYKWVCNVGSPSIIYSMQTHNTNDRGGAGGGLFSMFPCWQGCGSVENLRAILQCSRVFAANHSHSPASLCSDVAIYAYDKRADAVTSVI